jgi:molecular chaperone DnaJ
MKRTEAYSTLEISDGASVDEAKKAFRQLSKKYHPDNKDTGSEDKFKKINEAYQSISNNKFDDSPQRRPQQGGFHRQQVIQLENVEVTTTVSFKESVLGVKKEIKYNRQTKCQNCGGNGEVKLDNGCKKCGGKGQVIQRQGHAVMISTCTDCYGRSSATECNACSGVGTVSAQASVHVSVPAGIQDGNVLRLQGMGNFAGSFMGLADQFTDAYLHVTVTPEPGLSLDGANVISHLTIPLLDALRGCKRTVNTIHGEKEIKIPPQSRNCEEVIIPHCGVGNTGNQRVILDVEYPKNTEKLIGVLLDEVV